MDPDSFRRSDTGRLVLTNGQYWAFVPHPLPPRLDWTIELISALSQADRALGQLAGVGRTLRNPHLLIRPFLRREAVLSSRIEGTRASLSDVLAYEANQLSLFDLPADTREVYNYVRALEYGLGRLNEIPLSLRLLREMHSALMDGVRGQDQTPGEFRMRQNWIGTRYSQPHDADFVPPPVAEMLDSLDAFEKYLHMSSDLPPLVRIGLIHYQFETIHPFLDGNGRIGRLLIILLLCVWDLLPQPLLYLSAYFDAHRDKYTDLLFRVSEQGDWNAWLAFFLHGISSQAEDAIARAQQMQDLREHYRLHFQGARAAARLLQAVDLLFARPILTIRNVQDELQVEFPQAQRYVEQLAEAGVVEEITGKARYRAYRATEVLAAIENPLSTAEKSGPRQASQDRLTRFF
jgi:Fic family protein